MVAKAVVLPTTGSASLVIGLGLDSGVVAVAVNLFFREPFAPPPLYRHCATGAH